MPRCVRPERQTSDCGADSALQARSFVLHGPEHGYFASLAASLLEQSLALSSLFATVPARWPAVATAVSKFGAPLASRCN